MCRRYTVGPGVRHGYADGSVVDQLTRTLVRAVGDSAIVRVQGSVRLSQWSEPEPDVVLLAPRRDFYRAEFALGTDTLLVIEVSDTTLRYDRDVKVPLYARHGVPEAWIVDMKSDALLVYGGLRDAKYERHVALERPASVPVTRLPDIALDVLRCSCADRLQLAMGAAAAARRWRHAKGWAILAS